MQISVQTAYSWFSWANRRSIVWRWGSVVMAGLFVNLLIELAYGLLYRQYQMFVGGNSYLYAILIVAVVLRGLRAINTRLDHSLPWEKQPGRRFLLQTATNISYVLFTMLVFRLGAEYLLAYVTGDNYVVFLQQELIVAFIAVSVIFIVVLIDWGLFLLNRWRVSLGELERYRKERVEFQFEMLRNQVNPHFLFNSLNTISSLIHENPNEATKFVRQLARVYRHVLEHQNKELIVLRDELEFTRSYVFLATIRFSENLYVDIVVPEAYQGWYVVPMSLQLLIENAMKHNIVSRAKPLHVSIFVDEEQYLVVKNNLQVKPQSDFSSQMGLSNIRNRYSYLTEREVKIEQTAEFFTVRVPLMNRSVELAAKVEVPEIAESENES